MTDPEIFIIIIFMSVDGWSGNYGCYAKSKSDGRYAGVKSKVVWYFEEGGVLLWRGWCGTLKRVVWYFEDGCVVLWRVWRGSLKMVVWYFEEGGVEFQKGCCGTLKRVMRYFEDSVTLIFCCVFFMIKSRPKVSLRVLFLLLLTLTKCTPSTTRSSSILES